MLGQEGAQHHNQDALYSWSPEALYPDYQGTGKPGIYDPKGLLPGMGEQQKGSISHVFVSQPLHGLHGADTADCMPELPEP